jgi:hypothetical protein
MMHEMTRAAGRVQAADALAGKVRRRDEPRRLNRVVGAGEALQRTLDPVFRKRGFASRDLITHWAAMAPPPYDRFTAPERLAWPRGERQAGGAVLYLRCAEGHAVALQHEAPLIAKAINRYFGYVLVSAVRLSPAPFTNAAVQADPRAPTLPADPAIDAAVASVADDRLRDALRRLGQAIKARND